ncbi:MAG: putative metal-binding motif-containing protein [Bacteroidetes bacterium]|nr:putative metal-binding motif-containing protein [Bacteroidota bacterium]
MVGSVTNNTDCNDNNAAINPGAVEACNGVDDDCNGLIDDGVVSLMYYVDGDGDGYGAGWYSFLFSNRWTVTNIRIVMIIMRS